MGQKSSITRLDQRVRAEVDRLIREDAYTIDEILEYLHGLGGRASRSALGRYVRNARAQMDRYREAQEIAKVWVKKIDDDPEGDVGRLVAEMLRIVAFQMSGDLGEAKGAKPADVMLLARAIKDLAAADKASTEREFKIRDRVLQEAAREAGEAVKGAGLSQERVDELKSRILGLKAQ